MKSHHRKYTFFNDPYELETLQWKFEDIRYFNGEAILLIRNPFFAIR